MVTSSLVERPALVPVATVRKMLRVSKQRVYQLLGEGKLSGYQQDGVWLVSARTVEARLALLEKEAKAHESAR